MKLTQQERRCLQEAAENSGLRRHHSGSWAAVNQRHSGRIGVASDVRITHERFLQMEQAGFVKRENEWDQEVPPQRVPHMKEDGE